MASMAITSSLPRLQSPNKFAIDLRKSCSFRPSICASPKVSQARRCFGIKAELDDAAKKGSDAAKQSVGAAKEDADKLKKETFAAADNAIKKVGVVAGEMSETAEDAGSEVNQAVQDAAGKVQEAAEGAWGSVKDTAEKVKDNAAGQAEASVDSAKAAVIDGAAKIESAFSSDK